MDYFLGFFVDSYTNFDSTLGLSHLHYSVRSGKEISRHLTKEVETFSEVHSFYNCDAGPHTLSQVANPVDRLWFYFIGHGTKDAICLMNREGNTVLFSPESLLQALEKFNPSEVIVTIDSCHSGAFCKKLATEFENSAHIDKYLLISSTEADELAWEDPKLEFTCFSLALLESLKKANFQFPLFGLSKVFKLISKRTAASAYGLKKGAKQNVLFFENTPIAKSLGFYSALRRRFVAAFFTLALVLITALAVTKGTIYRLGMSHEREVVILRGPKFLSFTETFIQFLRPEHSDILTRTQIWANTISDTTALLDQKIWGIRGRNDRTTFTTSFSKLLEISYEEAAFALSSFVLTPDSDFPSMPPFFAAQRRILLGPIENDTAWPNLTEVRSQNPACGTFSYSGSSQIEEALSESPSLRLHSYFRTQILSKTSLNTVNVITALTMSEREETFNNYAFTVVGLPSSASKGAYSLTAVIQILMAQRGRSGHDAFLSETERNAIIETLEELKVSRGTAENLSRCRETSEYIFALMGQADSDFERISWSDLLIEMQESAKPYAPLPRDENGFPIFEENSPPTPFVPAVERLKALISVGQLNENPDFTDALSQVFQDLYYEQDLFNSSQRFMVENLTDLALSGPLPDDIVSSLFNILEEHRFFKFSTRWGKIDVYLLWLLSLQTQNMEDIKLTQLHELITKLETESTFYLEENPDQRSSQFLQETQTDIKQTLLIIWANMSRGGIVPDKWRLLLENSGPIMQPTGFGIVISNSIFLEPWHSTHPYLVASAIYGRDNPLTDLGVERLHNLLIEYELGRIPIRPIDPFTNRTKMTVNDPSMRQATICMAIAKNQFEGLSKQNVLEQLRQEIIAGNAPNQRRFSACPIAYWVSSLSHIEQQEYISLLRQLWTDEHDWLVKKSIAGIILYTAVLDQTLAKKS